MSIKDKEYLELLEFRAFLKGEYLDSVFKSFDEKDADMEKFDITIKAKGKEITLSTSADLYENLVRLIEKEIEEY